MLFIIGLFEKGAHMVLRKILATLMILGFLSASTLAAAEEFLTPQERQWVANHTTIRACVERDWAPFSYLDDHWNIVGLSTAYADTVVQSLGLKIHYIPYVKWADILEDTKAGKCDLLDGLYYTKERSKFIHFTVPYLKMKEYFFVREDAASVSSMKDILDKRIALVRGY